MNLPGRDNAYSGGGMLIMTLIFVVMFTVIFIGLSGLTSRQFRQGVLQTKDEQAFQIAEAGLNYARWRLAHNTEDLTSQTREIEDQFAGVLGSYDIEFSQQPGSTIVTILATGRTAVQPAREVTLRARYGIPSLARYALVTNDDVWYTSDLQGEVHSNGGIRMDGQSESLVTSAKETYVCQSFHGCNNEVKAGVWGAGEDSSLWEYPRPPVDYNALSVDLLAMKNTAQGLGTYYGPSGYYGYYIRFNDNNTYSIYRVRSKGQNVYSWFPEDGCCWVWGSQDMGTTQHIATEDIPSDGVIFTEDNVWIEGDIRDRVTVAAGRFPDNPSTNVDIILTGDITYGGVRDGTRSFGAIAQRHVLIPWSGAEDVMDIEGAFVAQKGRVGRRQYHTCCGGNTHNIKTQLNVFGMLGSNTVPVTAWTSSGSVVSGFQNRTYTYDPNLVYGPPPYFPTSGQYEFISWEQVE